MKYHLLHLKFFWFYLINYPKDEIILSIINCLLSRTMDIIIVSLMKILVMIIFLTKENEIWKNVSIYIHLLSEWCPEDTSSFSWLHQYWATACCKVSFPCLKKQPSKSAIVPNQHNRPSWVVPMSNGEKIILLYDHGNDGSICNEIYDFQNK